MLFTLMRKMLSYSVIRFTCVHKTLGKATTRLLGWGPPLERGPLLPSVLLLKISQNLKQRYSNRSNAPEVSAFRGLFLTRAPSNTSSTFQPNARLCFNTYNTSLLHVSACCINHFQEEPFVTLTKPSAFTLYCVKHRVLCK